MVEQISTTLSSVPVSVWVTLGAALGISTIVQTLKHYVDGLSDKTLVAVLTCLSATASVVDYVAGQAAQNPTILGPHTAELVGLATLLYRYVVKPAYGLVIDAKELRTLKGQTAPAVAAPADEPEFAV